MANGNEGGTPALGDVQARKLLEAPPAGTLKRVRDRAWLPCYITVSGVKSSAV
jgi:integrase/recombinase XerD